jgi:hypothetical protein
MKISGAKAHIFFDSFDPSRIITGDGSITTTAGQWYKIIEKDGAGDIPFMVGYIFRAPITGTQITLGVGDQIYPFEMDRICKTSADLSAEQGTIDVSDDCSPGSSILDGNITMSGSIGSLFQYNDTTGDFDNVTEAIVNRFFDVATDDGARDYSLTLRNDDDIYMLVNLNSTVKVGQIEPWICLPIIIASMSMSLGLTDAQNKDMSWNKGDGPAVVYKAPKAA